MAKSGYTTSRLPGKELLFRPFQLQSLFWYAVFVGSILQHNPISSYSTQSPLKSLVFNRRIPAGCNHHWIFTTVKSTVVFYNCPQDGEKQLWLILEVYNSTMIYAHTNSKWQCHRKGFFYLIHIPLFFLNGLQANGNIFLKAHTNTWLLLGEDSYTEVSPA